uniref:Actin-interacting protein 1 n=1 Tax=Parascaris univalens TaxID=6257 RepID=A0A915CE92_PARUN
MAPNDEYKKDAVFPSLPRTTRGLPLVLGSSPDGQMIVYCNGNSVFIRNVLNTRDCDVYTEHSALSTVAKFSPSGFYVASGDNSGKIRIWDATQPTHVLKAEYAVISGPIRDIAWSEDSKRIAVVGEGRERFGHVFLFDTGTSNGNLSGQSRSMSSIDFRPARPYRLVSASEDNTVALFEGPPFKFKTLFHEHTRFVHCVRYNSTGTMFASAGADGKVILYEGVEGGKQGEFVDQSCKGNAHDGGVFGLCWSPDDSNIATASGDKTVKVWNVATKMLLKVFHFENSVENQQLSIIWTKCGLFSVSLSGFIHCLDLETGSVVKTLRGHNKPITTLAVSADKSTAFTADFEGNITRWELSSGESERISPPVHKSQVSGLCISAQGQLVSVGWDDTIAYSDNAMGDLGAIRPEKVKLASQPRGISMSLDGSTVAVACQKAVVVFMNQKPLITLNIPFEASCVSLSADGRRVAVGGQDNKLRIFEVSGSQLVEKKELAHSGALTSVAWSPDGKHIVATDTARRVVPYSVEKDFAVASDKEWTFHTARVNCSAWSDDGRFVATGGLDTNVIVWDMKNTDEHPIIIRGAHSMSPVNGVAWLGPRKILSVGQDSVLKTWTLNV